LNSKLDLTVKINSGTTLRLSCRAKDFFVWVRYEDLFSESIGIIDIWEMKEGDSILMTNRFGDVPEWFDLHYSEITGSQTSNWLGKYQDLPPNTPLEGPNIWKVKSGDRLLWTGNTRPFQEEVNGILSIFDIHHDILVIGNSSRSNLEESITFGKINDSNDQLGIDRVRFGVNLIRKMGVPRTYSASNWGI
jgi:hypothetical protein